MVTQATRLLAEGDPISGMKPSFMTSPQAFATDDHTELIHTFYSTDDDSVYAAKALIVTVPMNVLDDVEFVASG